MEDISRETNIDHVVWLLIITLMQVYNEKDWLGQKETQSVQFEENKINTRKFNVGTKIYAERGEIKYSYNLNKKKGKGALMTKLHTAY